MTQNGLAWSPDGRAMYLSDAHAPRRQRVFVDMTQHPGRPDGAEDAYYAPHTSAERASVR